MLNIRGINKVYWIELNWLKTRAVIIQSFSIVDAFNRYYTIYHAVSIELRRGQPFVAICLTFHCFLWYLAFTTHFWILTTIKKALKKLLQPAFCMQSSSQLSKNFLTESQMKWKIIVCEEIIQFKSMYLILCTYLRLFTQIFLLSHCYCQVPVIVS